MKDYCPASGGAMAERSCSSCYDPLAIAVTAAASAWRLPARERWRSA